MDEKIIHQIALMAKMLGFLNETKYRDYCIKEEYQKMSKEFGKNTDDIEIELGEKHNLSPERIHKIMYSKIKISENSF